MNPGGGHEPLAPEALEIQLPAVIGERVDRDGGVLPCLDDLVEVADAALAHRARERAVDPFGRGAGEDVASQQVGCRHVLVTGDGVERDVEAAGHELDEARLAASGRALEHHRQSAPPGRREQLDLLAGGEVGRRRQAPRRHRCTAHGRIVLALTEPWVPGLRLAAARRSASPNSGRTCRRSSAASSSRRWERCPRRTRPLRARCCDRTLTHAHPTPAATASSSARRLSSWA